MSGKSDKNNVKERLHRERLARSRRSKSGAGGNDAKLAWIERAMNIGNGNTKTPSRSSSPQPASPEPAAALNRRTASPVRASRIPGTSSTARQRAAPAVSVRHRNGLNQLTGVRELRVKLRFVTMWRRNMAITKMRGRRRVVGHKGAVVTQLSAAVPAVAAVPKPRRRGSMNWSAPAAGSKAIGAKHMAGLTSLGGMLSTWQITITRRLIRKWRAAIMAKRMLLRKGAARPLQRRAPSVQVDGGAPLTAIELRRHQSEDKMHQLELRRLTDELAVAKDRLVVEIVSSSTMSQKIFELKERLHKCESGRGHLTHEVQVLETKLLKANQFEMRVVELEAEIQLLRTQNEEARHQLHQVHKRSEKEIEQFRIDLKMERARNAALAEVAEECEMLKLQVASLERTSLELRKCQDECSELREDYQHAVEAQTCADDTLNTTQDALGKSQHALVLTRDALAHSRREAEDLSMSCDDMRIELEGQEAEMAQSGAGEALLLEENLRLQVDLDRVLGDLEQCQDDNRSLHQQMAGSGSSSDEANHLKKQLKSADAKLRDYDARCEHYEEAVDQLKRQLDHAGDKLRKNHAVDNSQITASADSLNALQRELNLAEEQFQTELVQHQRTQEQLRAVRQQLDPQLDLSFSLQSPEIEIVAAVSPGGDSSPETDRHAELREELKEANHALKHAHKRIQSLSRSNSPAKVRSTGADELEKARLQHELNNALNELAFTPRGTPLPNKADTIMSGYLKKKGNFTSNERWCTLDGNYFRVHNKQGDVKPKYVIPLARLKSVQKQGDNEFIVIHMDGDALEMDANSRKICQQWLQAFKIAKEVAKSDNPLSLDSPQSTRSQEDQEPLEVFQKRFVELMVKHGDHKINKLEDMHRTSASAAEAALWVGWRDADGEECHEERTVVTVLTPARKGRSPVAMMCFNFSQKAHSLRLELDLPAEHLALEEPDWVHAIMNVAASATHMPSIECEVEVKAPKAPKMPSVECEVTAPKAPKMPSVECAVKMPSVECEVKMTSVECEVEVKVHNDGSKQFELVHNDDDEDDGDIDIDELRKVFDTFDTDHSGQINMEEMSDALNALDLEVEDGQVEQIFASVDKDVSGTIDFAEFCAVINFSEDSEGAEEDNFTGGMREVFNLFDTDSSGHIDVQELGDAMEALGMHDISRETVEATLRNFDTSQDGFIDFAEFCAIMSPLMDDTPPPPVATSKGTTGGAASASASQLVLIKEAFELFDLDATGLISASDLGDAMEALGLEVSDAKADHLAKDVCGQEGHEELDIDEFTLIVLPLWGELSAFPDF